MKNIIILLLLVVFSGCVSVPQNFIDNSEQDRIDNASRQDSIDNASRQDSIDNASRQERIDNSEQERQERIDNAEQEREEQEQERQAIQERLDNARQESEATRERLDNARQEREEQERIAKQDFIDNAKLNNLPIVISYINTSNPNSAGGVDLYITFMNISDKTIKYVIFSVEAYNAVDDPVRCNIKNDEYFNGQVTGPIEPLEQHGKNSLCENALYNNSIKYAKIESLTIIFMDNQEIVFNNQAVENMIYFE